MHSPMQELNKESSDITWINSVCIANFEQMIP